MASSKTFQGVTREDALSRAAAELGRPSSELEVLEVVSKRSSADAAPCIQLLIRVPEAGPGLDEAALLQGFRRPSAKVVEAASPRSASTPESPHRLEPAAATSSREPSREPRQTDGLSSKVLARKAEAFLADLLRHMGIGARLETELDDDDNVYIEIFAEGGVGGLLIGRQGQTLDAVQYLVNRVVLPGAAARGRVYLDTEGYRARYRRKLEEMAHKYRDEALRAGKPVTLEEFSPRDRWIIHQALLDDPRVTTRSVGDEPDRKLMIIPRR
ncbi:MAG: KH domain-containing protein [Deltaproteobacteria bacterium]|nr:KH domain-containing protein [Deltaproteobacteria bacterium]